MTLLLDTLSNIGNGLVRASARKCSIWTALYRVIKQKPWEWRQSPWTKELHDYNGNLACRKGAQLAFTELAINKTIYNMDVRKMSVLYLLPAEKPDARDFSVDRFDTAINESNHFSTIFSDIRNIGHKKAGPCSLYIRGARSDSGLKSIPVSFIVFDEYDEMDIDKVPLALERMSGSMVKEWMKLSTPTIPGCKIDKAFDEGTQEEYFFRCPSCDKLTNLTWENVVITADHINDPRIKDTYYICLNCKNPIPHEGKSEFLEPKLCQFVGKKPLAQVEHRSVWVSQLYSLTISPREMAISFFQSTQKVEYEVQHYNSKLGVPYIPKGGQVSQAQVQERKSSYKMHDAMIPNNKIRTLGVDVGRYLHYVLSEWHVEGKIGQDINVCAVCKVIRIGKIESFGQLDRLFIDSRANICVIDANPDRRMAKTFCDKFPKRAYLCYYANNVRANDIAEHNDYIVSVDRTSWLDLSIGRFFNKRILLPNDTPEEYEEHVKCVIRTIVPDSTGNPIARYLSQTSEDHYAHAQCYSEIGLPLACSRVTNRDIKSFL